MSEEGDDVNGGGGVMLIIRLGRQGICKDDYPAQCSRLKPRVLQKESPLSTNDRKEGFTAARRPC